MRYNPHDYQQLGIQTLLEQQTTGLLLKPGLGKTSTVLASRVLLKEQRLTKGLLVIAPLRPAYLVWPKEAQKWDDFHGLSLTVLHGPDKGKRLLEKHDVYVINPDGLPWLFSTLNKLCDSHHDWPFSDLVIDESSKFKNPATKRFRLMSKIVQNFQRRCILTGSPRPKSLMDLWAQVYLVDQGASLSPYITHFRQKYFTKLDDGLYVPHHDAQEQIYKRLEGKFLVMLDKDYLDLPPLSIVDVPVELPAEAMRAYKEMELQLKADIKEGRVTAANAGVAVGKCRQIANGGLYMSPGGNDPVVLHNAKTEAVVDLLDELEGASSLIAYEFGHDLQRLQAGLLKELRVRVMGGGMSMDETVAIEQLWNAGRLDVLLGQTSAVSHGLNLQEAGQAVIIHSLTYNYDDYDQLIRRLYRQGVKNPIIVYRLVAKGTVDEVMVRVLEQRERGQNSFFDALKTDLSKK